MEHQLQALQHAKKRAMVFLLIAAGIFVLTSGVFNSVLPVPPHWDLWVRCLKAISEAAMIGGLADWFAVSALFKHVPIPFLSRHTNIIPNNKDRIAQNLSHFIQEKFLNTVALTTLIQQKNPALLLAKWLSLPDNTQRLGQYFLRVLRNAFTLIEESTVQRFIREAFHRAINQVDMSQSAGLILESLIKNGRHQALLDQGLQQFSHLLNNAQTQNLIAEGIVDWLKDNHPVKEKILPSELIGKKGAKLAIATVSHLLNEVSTNPEHHLRHEFDTYTKQFIQKLQSDPAFKARGEHLKQYLLNDATFNTYLNDIWQSCKTWIMQDIERPDSVIGRYVTASSTWLGSALQKDSQLQHTLNHQIDIAAQAIVPQLGETLSSHIQDTVKQWDSQQLSAHIELNIGKDLQKIRINGTILGAVIGLLLFIISHGVEIWHWFIA